MRAVARLMVVGHHIAMVVGVHALQAVVAARNLAPAHVHAPTQAHHVAAQAAQAQPLPHKRKLVTPTHVAVPQAVGCLLLRVHVQRYTAMLSASSGQALGLGVAYQSVAQQEVYAVLAGRLATRYTNMAHVVLMETHAAAVFLAKLTKMQALSAKTPP